MARYTRRDYTNTVNPNRPVEFLKRREELHFVLLIDESASMMFPFLDDKNNYRKDKMQTEDFKNAVKKAQKTMIEAHKILLTALRGSSECKDGAVKIYQYKFNYRQEPLDVEQRLYSSGNDNVTNLDYNNYCPENGTALYHTLQESLETVFRKLQDIRTRTNRIEQTVLVAITDGEDTAVDDDNLKMEIIANIKKLMSGLTEKGFLRASVLIGLTSEDFDETHLDKLKKDINFDSVISYEVGEKGIRKALKTTSFATNDL